MARTFKCETSLNKIPVELIGGKDFKYPEYIGCTKAELLSHLEKQFQPGMTWENFGTWHHDHIVPLSSAKTIEEIYKLCHYTNLQPLWAVDNIKKSDKI